MIITIHADHFRREIADALREAESGDTIRVATATQMQLAKRAASRLAQNKRLMYEVVPEPLSIAAAFPAIFG